MSAFEFLRLVNLCKAFIASVLLMFYSISLMAAPTITSITGPANGEYTTNDTLQFLVNFSEDVVFTADSNGNSSHLVLQFDSGLGYAAYQSVSNSVVTFTYTPSALDFDADGLEVLEFSNIDLKNAGGDSADLTLNNVADFTQLLISHGNSAVLPQYDVYLPGDELIFTLAWKRIAAIAVSGGTPQLTITVGSTPYVLNGAATSNGTIEFSYTPNNSDIDTDGITVGALTLNGATLIGTLDELDDKSFGSHELALTSTTFVENGISSSVSAILVGQVNVPLVTSLNIPTSGAYNSGDVLNFTVNFDKPVMSSGGVNTWLRIELDNEKQVLATYNSAPYQLLSSWDFTYTLTADDVDLDGISLVGLEANNNYNDGALAFSDWGDLVVAGLADTSGITANVNNVLHITSVDVPSANTYVAGDTLTFTVHYDGVVTVTGSPYLSLIIDGQAVQAQYVSGSGTQALVFSYQLPDSLEDLDGISVDSLVLNGGTLESQASVSAEFDLINVSDTSSIVIQSGADVVSVELPSDATYGIDEWLTFTVNFDEIVTVTGNPILTINIGGQSKSAFYSSGSGSSSLVFSYQIKASDYDADGISLSEIRNDIGEIRNANNLKGNLTLNSVADGSNVFVDTGSPINYSVAIDQNIINAGNQSAISFTFTGATVGSLYTYSFDSAGGSGSQVTGAGTITSANQQFSNLDLSGMDDGEVILSVSLASGNDSQLKGPIVTSQVTKYVTKPTVSSVDVPVATFYASYYTGTGSILNFTVNLDKAVVVTGAPRIPINIGGNVLYADYDQSQSSSIALVFTYTLPSSNSMLDSDGITISPIDLNGGTVKDLIGDNVDLTLNNVGDLTEVLVTADSLTPLNWNTSGFSGNYQTGDTLTVTFTNPNNFSFNVVGAPELVLSLDSGDITAMHVPTGNSNLTFSYVLQASDVHSGDNEVTISGINLPTGTTIETAFINSKVNSDLGSITIYSDIAASGVVINTESVGTSSVRSIDYSSGTYKENEILNFTLTFNESVDVNGAPQLALNVGGSIVNAAYVSGTGSTELLFSYSVASGLNDDNGIVLSSIDITGGTITGGDTLATDLTLANMVDSGSISGIKIDTSVPTLVSINPSDNATGIANDAVFSITFNENISFGSGSISLKQASNNATIEQINSGSNQLSISGKTLTIDPSITLSELVEYYLQIDAGALTDSVGNAFVGITDTTSWSVTSADISPPMVTSINVNGSPNSNDSSLIFTVTLNESSQNFSTSDFSLETISGNATGLLSAVSAYNGLTTNVTVSSVTGAGDIRLNLNSNSNIMDSFGNGNGNNGYVPAFVTGSTHSVDRTAPALTVITEVPSLTANSTPNFSFSIDEIGTLSMAGSCGTSSNTTLTSTGTHTIVLTQADNITALTEASYSNCTLNVTDAAGNTSKALTIGTFVIDLTSPTLVNNVAMTLMEGADGEAVTSIKLSATDAMDSDTNIIYQLISVPANGLLRRNTSTLAIGDTFEQVDINSGIIFYDHDNSETLADTFIFDLADSAGNINSNAATHFTYNITIMADNDAPVVIADTYALDEGATINIAAAAGVLANDSDAENDPLTATLISDVYYGSLTLEADGSFEYIHDGSENIVDNFSYQANDTLLDSNIVSVEINLNSINEAPIITGSALLTATEDTAYEYFLFASDIENDSLTWIEKSGSSLPSWLSINIGNQVSSFAGANQSGNSDGQGSSAAFNSPKGLAIDNDLNVYVADSLNHLIRKIDAQGNVTTLAGTGNSGSQNAVGQSASFNAPEGVAVDGEGNVYVADTGNHLIRKIDLSGNVTTFAGNITSGFSDANGVNAAFNAPTALTIDASGNVYVSDTGNHAIRKIDSSAEVTTFAGSGSPGRVDSQGINAVFDTPLGIALDSNGNLFIADSANQLIRKIDTNANVTTFAGTFSVTGNYDGNGVNATFTQPFALAIDQFNNIYVSEQTSNQIRIINASAKVNTLSNSTTNGLFSNIQGITVDDSGIVYASDADLNQLMTLENFTKLSGTPLNADVGIHAVCLEVNDSDLSDDECFSILVTNTNDAPSGAVTISGTLTENQTLTALNTLADDDGLGTFEYLWYRNSTVILGASESTYVLGDDDVDALIRVSIRYTDGAGYTETVTSADSVAISNVNDVPTGTVSILGAPVENQTLTAVNTLVDNDGLGTISYQWQRDSVNINTETNSTYVLSNSDVGRQISVVASYTDAQSNPESVVSAATVAIVNVNDLPMGTVSISGTTSENETLTAIVSLTDGDGLGSFSYQWMRNNVAIIGATSTTYLLIDADVNTSLSVKVNYTDAHSTVESVTSSASAIILNQNDAPTGSVIISGTVQEDEQLTVSNTLTDDDGLGVITYQWKRAGVDIASATEATYTLTDEDVGTAISVTASYLDANGTGEAITSANTINVVNVNDAVTGGVSIIGNAVENQTLTAVNTLADDDGLGTISYQWRRDNSDIAMASSNTYVLVEADVASLITVKATFTDGNGTVESVTSAATSTITNVNDSLTGTVSISGNATEDQTLTASNDLADIDGLGTISYQWNRNGSPISAANTSTFVLGDADVGSVISVTASFTDGNGTPESLTSAPTSSIVNINDNLVGTLTISGTSTEDQILTAVNNLSDADGLGTINYQWRRAGLSISSATSVTYTLTDADVGQIIRVVASYTDGHGTVESITSSATATVANVNDNVKGTVVILGTPSENQTLSADHNLSDNDGLGVVTYQWIRNGVHINGETSNSLVLGDADVDTLITVTASYTDGQGTLESVTSTATSAVANVNDALSGEVSINGIFAENETLSLNNTLADNDGLGEFSYQWQRDGVNIDSAHFDAYVLTNADVGSTLTVIVSYTDGNGTLESYTTSASSNINNVNDLPLGSVLISGNAIENSVLIATNTLSDLDGLGTFNYQWLRDNIAITGANDSTYLLVNDDVGSVISVTISYVDQRNTSEQVTSEVTAQVVNTNDATIFTSIALTQINEDTLYHYQVTVSDVDVGDELVMSASVIPTWLTFNVETGVLEGVPSNNDVGEHTVILTVNDGIQDSYQNFTITVLNVNDAPVLSANPQLIVNVGSNYKTAVFVSDVDNTTFEFEIENMPAWAQFDTSTGVLSGVPASSDVGVYSGIMIHVTDGDLIDSLASFDIQVTMVTPKAVSFDAQGLFTKLNKAQLLGLNKTASVAQINNALQTLLSDVDGYQCCTANIEGMQNDVISLIPGRHAVVWTLGNGSNFKVVQQVDINPLVSLGQDQFGIENTSVAVRVLLNGLAPEYPLVVPISISSDSTATMNDHNFTNTSVTFSQDEQEVIMMVSILKDNISESDETLILDISNKDANSQVNPRINLGANTRQTITISQRNIAPEVSMSIVQAGLETIEIARNDGSVVISAHVYDVNSADTHSYNWAFSSDNLVAGNTNRFEFNPASMALGTYQATVTVKDSSNAIRTAGVYFKVVETATVLSNSLDSDKDGINDKEEGRGDYDHDGIPNYLDAISSLNVLQEVALESDDFLVECTPGVNCRLGQFSFISSAGGAHISDQDILNNQHIFADKDFTVVGGIFDFEIHDLPNPGQSIQVVIPQLAAIPEKAKYRKFMNNQWLTFIENESNALHSAEGELGICPPPSSNQWQTGLNTGHYCVQLTLQDGGPNDSDGLENGIIIDPGAVSTENISVVSGNGGGSKKTGALSFFYILCFSLIVISRKLLTMLVTQLFWSSIRR